MRVLIVSATPFEFYDFREAVSNESGLLAEKGMYIDFLVGGVGLVHTTAKLMDYLHHQSVDLAIQMGIAGSFRHKYAPLDLVQVVSEAFGDTGAEDGDEYLDLFELNLWEVNEPPFENKLLFAPEQIPLKIGNELPQVHGISVNTVAGKESTIALRRKKYAADVESMEGAAFHFVCRSMNIPFRQIRAISNYVTPRDTSTWKLKESIRKLNRYFVDFFLG